jgi:hypothetical protein
MPTTPEPTTRPTVPDLHWMWLASRFVTSGLAEGPGYHFGVSWRITYPDWALIRSFAQGRQWAGAVDTRFYPDRGPVYYLFGLIVDLVPPAEPREPQRWPELVVTIDRRN